MENVQEMTLVGFYHFASKDKTKHYYVVQALSNQVEDGKAINKASVVDVFVSEDIYNSIINKDIGEILNVQIIPNLSTGKLSFKICL